MPNNNLVGFSSNNQRIRSLAEKASIYCINGHFKAPWTYEDKIAELIIRRCADLVDTAYGDFLLAHFDLESQD